MLSYTTELVECVLEALGASEYIVRLIHDSKPPINKKIDACQILKELKFYQAKNVEGYNIYFRPVGYEFVLLDDLSREVLGELATLKPCLIIETSRRNYQAWLKMENIPQGRDEALQICKELASLLAADMGSAEPDHIGRLPGFTNRKPKHQQPDGNFPFVGLRRWKTRYSTFSPLAGIVAQINPAIAPPTKHKDHDRSREDFNLCCMLIRQGKTDDYIRQKLESTSDKAKEVKQSFDYIGKTIRNARERLID